MMTQEEKAKRYDEILARAKGANLPYYKEDIMSKVKEFVDYLLPELKESEDERIRKDIKQHFLHLDDTFPDKAKWLAWLEKQGESTEINPSEFDSQLNRLLKQFESLPKEDLTSSLSFYLNVVHNGTYEEEKQGEQKPVWSEEDEKLWLHDDDIFLDAAKMIVVDSRRKSYGGVHKNEIVPWLLSLKERLKYIKNRVQPQNRWKPSDNQMKALNDINLTGNISYAGQGQELINLYNDLKKIKESKL